MAWHGTENTGVASGFWLAGAVGLLAIPSAVLAISSGGEVAPAESALTATDSASDSARYARAFPTLSLAKGQLFRFTPARTASRSDSSVTVVVRVDPSSSLRGIQVRGKQIEQAAAQPGNLPVGIAPTAFSLGVARGYHDFAQNLVPAQEVKAIEMPDLSAFPKAATAKGDPARFSPRIVMDAKHAAGRAPRTFSGDGTDLVDLGGSYRVTGNLNVTAGVRYAEERDRLKPVTNGRKDSQSIYVGTQFRF